MDVVNAEQVRKLSSVSDGMELNSIRLALLKRPGLAQSWHWSVYQQIFATTAGLLEWCATSRNPIIRPADAGLAE